MQCAIYTRVSTDNQLKRNIAPVKLRKKKINAYIRSQENLKFDKVYSDPRFSGASLDRPALQKMTNDIIKIVQNGSPFWTGDLGTFVSVES